MALHHAEPGEVVDLAPLGSDIEISRTTAIARTKSFETVRLVVTEGRVIAPHAVPGEITLYCLEGRVRLDIDEASLELAAGQWVFLEGGRTHSVTGIEDASLVLTILFEGADRAPLQR